MTHQDVVDDDANREWYNSRPLDVHRWSDYPEVNSFVNAIFDTHFTDEEGNQTIRKKHLKVVLLDLYICWLEDPEAHLAAHMKKDAYSNGTVAVKGKSRYNELHIKYTITKVIHHLEETGLIGLKGGFKNPDGFGRLTRIWAKPSLVKMFEDAAFGYFHIGYADKRVVIEMRDEDKLPIPFDPSNEVMEMESILKRYNALLERSFIDIPHADKPRIELKEKKKRRKSNRPLFVQLSHHAKFVKRIFNNESWQDGGRFYGGWWQRIDADERAKIRINNTSTVEIDYSAIHIVLMYAEAKIDYWEMTDKDPYDLPVRDINNPEHARNVVKLFFLLAVNASDEDKLFRAFRNSHDYDTMPYSFTNEVLGDLLETIKQAHPDIAKFICTGAGIKLMRQDSDMVSYIIEQMTKDDVPVLSVHDSFIVPFGQEDRLYQLMKEAFTLITGKLHIQMKWNDNLTKKQLYAHGAQDRDFYLDSVMHITKPEASNGYQRRMERHKAFYGRS